MTYHSVAVATVWLTAAERFHATPIIAGLVEQADCSPPQSPPNSISVLRICAFALDYRLRAGKMQVCTVHDLRVELPTSAEFLKTNFEDRALNEKIKAAEG